MFNGLVLFYVGVVLILNGLWMLDRIADREILIVNVLVGLLNLRVAHEYAFAPGADPASVRAAAMGLLFAFTYLWVACNRWLGNDGRGLGWFSLLVAITVAIVALQALSRASSGWELWAALSWAAWALLWLLFFMLLVLGRPSPRPIGWLSIAQGVLTGWAPGFWLLQQ